MPKQGRTAEIELAWLVRKFPKNLDKCKSVIILQGYLPNKNGKVKDVRIRSKNGTYTQTVKYFAKDPKETGYNWEETKKLTKKQFDNLYIKANKKIKKKRYYYPLENNLIAEIDVYLDNLKGLKVVEVEFPDINAYKEFTPLSWFGKEVTDSKGIYPPHIADLSISKVRKINDKYVQEPHDFG